MANDDVGRRLTTKRFPLEREPFSSHGAQGGT
jgi:hypothetical protein